jgi:hypothetical protein
LPNGAVGVQREKWLAILASPTCIHEKRDLAAAWHWNALIVGSLPLTLGFLGLTYRRALQQLPFEWPRVNRLALVVILLLTGAFTILRNI